MARKPKPPRRDFAILLGGATVLLTLAGLYLFLLGGTNPAQTSSVGGPFKLAASDGRIVSDQSFRGQYLLIYFGYSSCQDICPATLAAMAGALDALGPRAARIQPLLITVDPRRDTQAVLRGYVANFSPRLLGLTGTPRQLSAVQREYRVSAIAHSGSNALASNTIDHSSVLLLMGPDGNFLGPIRADESAAQMAADLARYLT